MLSLQKKPFTLEENPLEEITWIRGGCSRCCEPTLLYNNYVIDGVEALTLCSQSACCFSIQALGLNAVSDVSDSPSFIFSLSLSLSPISLSLGCLCSEAAGSLQSEDSPHPSVSISPGFLAAAVHHQLGRVRQA